MAYAVTNLVYPFYPDQEFPTFPLPSLENLQYPKRKHLLGQTDLRMWKKNKK